MATRTRRNRQPEPEPDQQQVSQEQATVTDSLTLDESAAASATATAAETVNTGGGGGGAGSGAGSGAFSEPDPEDGARTRPRTRRQNLEQLLAERIAVREPAEKIEQQRASTPLALELVVISCRWAVERWVSDRTIPEFVFPQRKCHLGKTTPDQDCRNCVNVKPIPYGTRTLGHHERRYHDHGMVFPIPDDGAAEDLAHYLRARNMSHLRHIEQEIAWLEQQIAAEIAQEQAALERARLEALAAQEAAQRATALAQQNPLRPTSADGSI